MKDMTFLEEVLGTVYVSNQSDDLIFNYSFLLKEKKKILDKINTCLMYEEESEITLEDWHLDLLQLQLTRIILDDQGNVIEYPKYHSHKEKVLISILKKISYTPQTITKEEFDILIKFFKSRKIVESIIGKSDSGIRVNKNELSIIMTLFKDYTITTGTNIIIYESLCNQLSLTKKDNYKLEKKVA